MGEREMFLVLGAMLFFTMTSLSVNRFCLDNNEVMMKSEFDYYAISLGQGIIEEAKTREFDSSIAFGTANTLPDDFTYPLGCRYDEQYPNFNDVDDYNGLNLDITANINGPKANYQVVVHVGYVEEHDLNTFVGYKTFHKRMTVIVTSDFITAPVILSHVFSYYAFG